MGVQKSQHEKGRNFYTLFSLVLCISDGLAKGDFCGILFGNARLGKKSVLFC